jgi:hypothetical protein
MDKEITYKEFYTEVYEQYKKEDYKYGSIQFPAQRAAHEFTLRGVTNAQEMLEKFRKEQGDNFYYAGD